MIKLFLSLILFTSGFCALIYQTVWLKEFRLLFGGAAPAAAAVLSVFMGGLGFGGLFFGSRVEKIKRPFLFYVKLESAIAILALISPFVLQLARSVYLNTGGIAELGMFSASCLQILITIFVLGPICFCMGGTLPAAMKFAQSEADVSRSTTAYFYGINVLGAVSGATLSTFLLLPLLGDFKSLVIAVIANIIIVLLAAYISLRFETTNSEDPIANIENLAAPLSIQTSWTTRFVLLAALMSGLTFFLMEMVWYRVTTPLFGSTVYGFGLVLSIVLLGIGIGGFFYSKVIKSWKPTFEMFTLVSALQAFFLLLPYFFGDAIAHLALVLSECFRHFGLSLLVCSWTFLLLIILFIPSFISGIQFPLLISLLGKGNQGIAKELGLTYAFNTVGSIIGLISGGFFLMPWLGLTHCWLLVGFLVAAMSILSIIANALEKRSSTDSLSSTNIYHGSTIAALILITLTFVFSQICDGPTAYWLQSPIGYGRTPQFARSSYEYLINRENAKTHVVEHYDGRETSVSLVNSGEYAFLTNGKSDGSAFGDAQTVIGMAMLGAVLHEQPEKACIVGLGTGSTAGWLAEVPSIQRVDVLELEPAIFKIAEAFKAVNANCMTHPKVNAILGDAREFLMTTKERYDLIISEPSNPCRAGVANLYTHEFYQSALQKMTANGIFCQWIQAYEVTPEVIQMIAATLQQTFKHTEMWRLGRSDLLFIAKNHDKPWDIAQIRQKIQVYPYNNAFHHQFYCDSAEGVLSSCFANHEYTRKFIASCPNINHDDHNLLEYSFAQSLGNRRQVLQPLLIGASKQNQNFPHSIKDPQWNESLYEQERLMYPLLHWNTLDPKYLSANTSEPTKILSKKLEKFAQNEFQTFYQETSTEPIQSLTLRYFLAHAAVASNHADIPNRLNSIKTQLPCEALFLQTKWKSTTLTPEQLIPEIKDCIQTLQKEVWCRRELISQFYGILQKNYLGENTTAPTKNQIFDILNTELPAALTNTTQQEFLFNLAPFVDISRKKDLLKRFPKFTRTLSSLSTAYEVYDHLHDETKANECLNLIDHITNLSPESLPGYRSLFDFDP